MRLGKNSLGRSLAQGLDLTLGQGCGQAIEVYKSYHSRDLQYSQPLLDRNANKNVSRKQHQIQFFSPVFPSPYTAIKGHESIDISFGQLLQDPFLVMHAGVSGIPKGRGA